MALKAFEYKMHHANGSIQRELYFSCTSTIIISQFPLATWIYTAASLRNSISMKYFPADTELDSRNFRKPAIS